MSIFISISKFWKNKNLLKNQKIICGHNQYTFSIQLDFLAYENFSYMHIFVYDFLLNSILGLMKRNSSMSLNGLISSEMVGIQSFLERKAALTHNLRHLNLQTASKTYKYFPIKSVGGLTCVFQKQMPTHLIMVLQTTGMEFSGVT